TRHVPVLMRTARTDEVDRVVGFEVGADDFVTKPCSVRELVLRVRAILRRGGGAEGDQERDQVGPIRVDPAAHRAYVDGQEVALTALEFKLLTTFMTRLGRVQTRESLLQDVWGVSSDLQTRTVDTHVKRLRETLGAGRDLIETVRGIGYRMVEPPRGAREARMLEGKIALVPGASAGIGLAVARAVVAGGGRVAMVARTELNLREVARELGADRASIYPLDVTDLARLEELPARVLERFGALDLPVNNAGLNHRRPPL